MMMMLMMMKIFVEEVPVTWSDFQERRYGDN